MKSWKTDELIFTLTAQATGKIRIGFAANEGVGSANHAKILVDYVKLLCDDMDKGGLETAFGGAGSLRRRLGCVCRRIESCDRRSADGL